MEEVVITARSVEIRKKKDADGGDVYAVSHLRAGTAGNFNVSGNTGGIYSSWDRVLEELKDLNLPSRLLNGARKQLDSVDFVRINLAETPGIGALPGDTSDTEKPETT